MQEVVDHIKEKTNIDGFLTVPYQVIDSKTICIYERLNDISVLNMEIAKAGILVDSIGVVASDLEEYFLKTTANK